MPQSNEREHVTIGILGTPPLSLISVSTSVADPMRC